VQRHRYDYGQDPSQWGELFLPDLPAGRKHRGVVVVIHGGYWRSTYGAELGEPLARDLAEHGMAAWNLEYRRAGNGGGWPGTFQDILAASTSLPRSQNRTRWTWAKWWRWAIPPAATWQCGRRAGTGWRGSGRTPGK